MLVQLADWCYRQRRLVIVLWIAALAAGFALASLTSEPAAAGPSISCRAIDMPAVSSPWIEPNTRTRDPAVTRQRVRRRRLHHERGEEVDRPDRIASTRSRGQKPVKLDWSKLSPTNAVKRNQAGCTQ